MWGVGNVLMFLSTMRHIKNGMVILTNGLLFEFQHINRMDTDLIDWVKNMKAFPLMHC